MIENYLSLYLGRGRQRRDNRIVYSADSNFRVAYSLILKKGLSYHGLSQKIQRTPNGSYAFVSPDVDGLDRGLKVSIARLGSWD